MGRCAGVRESVLTSRADLIRVSLILIFLQMNNRLYTDFPLDPRKSVHSHGIDIHKLVRKVSRVIAELRDLVNH